MYLHRWHVPSSPPLASLSLLKVSSLLKKNSWSTGWAGIVFCSRLCPWPTQWVTPFWTLHIDKEPLSTGNPLENLGRVLSHCKLTENVTTELLMTINSQTIVLPNNDKTFTHGQTPLSDQRVYCDKGLKHQMKLRFTREDVSRVSNVLWSPPNLLKLHWF